MSSNIKKILLTGGGTGGSVMPLLAMVEEIRNFLPAPACADRQTGKLEIGSIEFLWLGTRRGPENEMVRKENVEFKAILSGKLRRYFSWRNFIDPFFIKIGFWQAFFIMLKWRPDLVISAGSFVGVPVAWAAWVLRVPVLIHQQDIKPGLANKLMAPFAKVITVTFEKSLKDYGKKAVWTGNPVRKEIRNWKLEIGAVKKNFNLRDNLPTVLIIGGGTGALTINELVEQSAKELVKFCQVILVAGKDKSTNFQFPISNFQYFEFLNAEQMAEVYSLANVVVSRCGMGALTELSYLSKPPILIPIPDSHQEDNAQIFKEKEAAIVLDQNELTPDKFVNNIKKLVYDSQLRNKLRNNIKQVIKSGANKEIVKIIKEIIK